MKSFLSTALTVVFIVNTVKKLFYRFVNEVTWVTIFIQNTFQKIYLIMEFHKIRAQTETSEQQ